VRKSSINVNVDTGTRKQNTAMILDVNYAIALMSNASPRVDDPKF